MMGKGHLLKRVNGKMVDGNEITFDQIYTMGRMDLEKQTIYLMRKRTALEEAIADLQRKNKNLFNAVKNRDRNIEILTEELDKQKKLMSQQLERLNKEHDATLREIIDENVRLTNENVVLKKRVARSEMVG